MEKDELLEIKNKILRLDNFYDINKVLPNKSIYQFLLESNKNKLNSIAINYFGHKITYRELIQKIDYFAAGLKSMGVKPGDYVTLSSLSVPEGVIAFYAISKLGAISHMINPVSSEVEIKDHLSRVDSNIWIIMDLAYNNKTKKIAKDCGVNKIIHFSLIDSLPAVFNFDRMKLQIATLLKADKKILSGDECVSFDEVIENGKNSDLVIEPYYENNSIASIAYTSGSIESKGVKMSHNAFNAMPILTQLSDRRFTGDDVFFNTLPLWIFFSLSNGIHEPLILNATIALDPLFNEKNAAKRLQQYHFNYWHTIPAMAEGLVYSKNIEKADTSCIKAIATGGDYLDKSVVERGKKVGINVCPGYGSSETNGGIAYTYDEVNSEGSVGRQLFGNKYKIVDVDTNKIIATNVDEYNIDNQYYKTGELYIYSPTMMSGYLKNEKATNESLVKDSFGILWYKTEDLFHINEKQELFMDGRIRRIVMTRDSEGQPTKLFPDRIRNYLLNNGIIDKCAVITVEDSVIDNKPVLFVVPKDQIEDETEFKNNIIDICKQGLASYMVPSDVIVLSEIPLTPAMKTNFKELSNIYSEYELAKSSKQKIKKR